MKTDLQLSDLNNPDKIVGIQTTKDGFIDADLTYQGFQETKGRWQLWAKWEGQLLCIKAWNKSSVLATYTA